MGECETRGGVSLGEGEGGGGRDVRGWEESRKSEEGEGGELHFDGLFENSRSLEMGGWTKEREWEVEILELWMLRVRCWMGCGEGESL